MVRREKSVVDQLVQNRSSFYMLKLQWEVDDVYELAEAISRNHTVRYVFLYDHFMASVSMNGRREVLKAIACLHKLESLVYVSQSTRVKIPVDSLSKILRCSKRLSSFELHGPSLVGKPSDFAEFADCISKLRALKSFKLLPAFFDRKVDLDPLMGALSKLESLAEIRICLYCEKGSRLSSLPLQQICQLRLLRVLDLRWPHLCDEHLTAVAKELRYNTTLEELRIGGNNLSYSCFSVAEMIEHNVGIRRLSLACRGLGNSECCKALWKAIEANYNLKEVTFENTDLTSNRGQDTCAVMEKVLKGNQSLIALRLHNMGLDDDSCAALGRALQVNSSLRELDLRKGNKHISDEGYEALAGMLERNFSLYSLQTNAIKDHRIKHQIDVCLKLNQSAKKIELQHRELIRGPLEERKKGMLLCGGL